ncbi:MAG: ATP-dependent DNA helicase RecG [Candidatus Mesenet longicola]|uniref:Probable DNA 3'-5' helicase RecG n=1 Tax=Candidatus Mesenet longicola TaxID=1892558 RepID=A0A8J3HTD0_9RICK|nr:MAG: ATP-dependent DNA helicase RecG [Candidatus Mesenet longicola]GHM59903.1 MAG: ATP-dependent DNA helicase RecG [Candidatus Mesenet longicola]
MLMDKKSYLFSDIINLPGISKITQKILGKLCGTRIIDVLFFRPCRYIDRRNHPLTAKSGEYVTFTAKINMHKPPAVRNKPYRIILELEGQQLTLIFFHYSVKYLKQALPIGEACVISGKLETFLEQLQITHPDYISLDISSFDEVCRIEPIYRLSRGITSRKISKIVASALKIMPEFPEWIDGNFVEEKGWLSFKISLSKLHNLDSLEEMEMCRLRLAYDEFTIQQIALRVARYKQMKEKGRKFLVRNKYKDQVMRRLEFELTQDQIRAINDISNEQQSQHRMIRLLQGDVGSGKTVVALFAILNAVENNCQAALMAPTAILVEQHYSWFKEVLSGTDIKITLLTGKIKQKERKTIMPALQDGSLDIVIGTHALFQERVKFKDLALVVIDEQQRFGVMQRNSLIQKGNSVDILFISATPIPRTLRQALYGDIEHCSLKEKPKCRVPISTVATNIKKTSNVISSLKRAIDLGKKAYWICPCIEDNESLSVAAAEERFAQLQKVFKENNIGLIHGRLEQKQKDEIMLSFRVGEISLLVATTVIEVGIDVPDATIIVIENAENFGLSQLHQLRGRVGRGDQPSFCILLYDKLNKSSHLKLKTMRESQDGFYIAQQDMLLRGSGDVLGIKQSGNIEFKFADIYKDKELLNRAYSKAKDIVENDPTLTEIQNQPLKELLNIFGYNEEFEFLR